jgi:hypothetical protein
MAHLDLFLVQNKEKRSLTDSMIQAEAGRPQSAPRNKVTPNTPVAKRRQRLSIKRLIK